MITASRIQHLYDRYLELVRLEIDEFGFKPTEVRHRSNISFKADGFAAA